MQDLRKKKPMRADRLRSLGFVWIVLIPVLRFLFCLSVQFFQDL